MCAAAAAAVVVIVEGLDSIKCRIALAAFGSFEFFSLSLSLSLSRSRQEKLMLNKSCPTRLREEKIIREIDSSDGNMKQLQLQLLSHSSVV